LFIKRRQDLDFIIKAHPSFDHYELYRQIKKFNLPNYSFEEDIDLKHAIKDSMACVLINYFTTATLDVLINNVPVIFLQNAVYPLDSWFTNDLNSVIPKVDNVKDLEAFIDKIGCDHLFKIEILNKSKFLLKSILFNEVGLASSNLFDFLNSLKLNHFSAKADIELVHTPFNYFIFGATNSQIHYSFNFKIFRFDSKLNSAPFSTLLKFYLIGSNSGKSKENFWSLIYLFVILLFNLDLIFKIKYFRNIEVLKFFHRQILG
jgi:hypothetical protein